MGVIPQLLDAIAVLIPDFQVLSLSASVFFSLYCCASSLGFSWAKGVDWGFLFSLFLGFAIIVTLNIVSFLSSPSAPTAATVPLPRQYSQNTDSIRRHANDATPPLELQASYVCRFEKQPDTRDSGVRFSG